MRWRLLAAGLMTAGGHVILAAAQPHAARHHHQEDWILYSLLLIQVATGLSVALMHRWGSSWFASAMGPYVWSLLSFRPNLSYLAGASWLIKAHIVNAFVIIAFFPFTRLVHILVVPNQYLMRKTQVVRWNHDRLTIRKAE